MLSSRMTLGVVGRSSRLKSGVRSERKTFQKGETSCPPLALPSLLEVGKAIEAGIIVPASTFLFAVRPGCAPTDHLLSTPLGLQRAKPKAPFQTSSTHRLGASTQVPGKQGESL